ncbi:unnamed protein product [Mytilus edulis]|uniref:G-protein coupled receptors family 2 profile 2 domain-containing protein n=1 Tax=Mytilus edulis TaxID=6550 RepID=A0A8S3SG03_MYTED|nr:unnamed protein product [Mytilus edulis]
MIVCKMFLLESCLKFSIIVSLSQFAFVGCQDSNDGTLESTEQYSNLLGYTDAMQDQTHIVTSLDTTSSETNGKVDVLSDSCSMYGTCEYISDMQIPICHCDEICNRYKDCCIDANIIDVNDTGDPQFECISDVIQSNDKREYYGIFVINSCPKHLRDTAIDKKCRTDDLLEAGPWVASETNLVFQNRFCAACYNVDSYKPFALNISAIPQDFFLEQINSTTIGKLIDLLTDPWKHKIKTQLIPPENIDIRFCLMIDQPPEDRDDYCLDYKLNPVIDIGPHNFPNRNPVYRNQFCLPTNHYFECLGKYKDIIVPFEEMHSLFPLSVMFPFKRRNHRCENEVNGLCIDNELYVNYETNKIFSLISSTFITWSVVEQLVQIMSWSIHAEIKAVQIRYYNINGVNGTGKNNYTSYVINQIHMNARIQKKLTANAMLDFETKYKNAVWSITINDSNGLAEVNIVEDSSLSTLVYPKKKLNEQEIETKTENLNVDIKGNFTSRLCDKTVIVCNIIDGNRDQELTVKEITCIDFPQRSTTTSNAMDVSMKVITYTGMGISVIALTVSVIVHRRLGMHISIPGSNVENLSVALLCADVAFLIGVGANDYYLVCYGVGVILHYLWLLVFSLKSIALIDMCYTITQMSTNISYANRETQNKKRKLSFLGLFIPIMIVAPAVVIDLGKVSEFNLDYSGSICFPTGYPANLIFVSIPIGLSVFINVTCFICIAGFIAKQSFEQKHVRQSNSFKHIPVFARISVVTGMLWTTGLIGAIVQTEFMEYLFVVCCSFQGLLISIANLTTRRVYRAWVNHGKSSTS